MCTQSHLLCCLFLPAEYKGVVGLFVLLQIIGWAFSFGEAAQLVGPTASAIVNGLTPMDVTFCQILFFGTLHHGLLDDGRLCWVCRIAFGVDGVAFLINSATVWRPQDTQEALDALDPNHVPNMTQGYIGGLIWFVMYSVFSAWVGVQTLVVARLRVITGVGRDSIARFSTQLIRVQAASLMLQLAIGIWMAANIRAALELPAEQQIRASSTNGGLMNVSFMLAQLYAFKVVLLDATGATMADFFKCRVKRACYMGAAFVVLYIVITLGNALIMLTAPSSTDPLFLLARQLIGTYNLQNAAMIGVWVSAANNFGMTLSHLRNTERAEAQRMARHGTKGGGKSAASVSF